jgi:hypothetical protein
VNLNIFTANDAARVAEAVKATEKSGTDIALEGQARKPGETPQVSADDLYSQIVKYVPTPLLGLYLLAVNAASSSFSGNTERVTLWVIFIVFGVAVVGFLRTRKVDRWTQIGISVAAFAAWVAASPGPFQAIAGYPDVIGTFALIAVVLVTLVFHLNPLPDEVINDSKP